MEKKFEFNMCGKINKLQLYISFDFFLFLIKKRHFWWENKRCELNIIPRFNFFSKLSKQVSVLWPTICLHQSNSSIAIISISFGCLKILAKIQISFESRFSWFHNAPHKIRQRCRVLALTFVPINFYRTVCFVHGMLVHSALFLV